MLRVPRSRPDIKSSKDKPCDQQVDLREQLVNNCEVGLIQQVSVPEVMITSLRGIMLDFDPDRLCKGFVSAPALQDPKKFWQTVVDPWLARHPVYDSAEVRTSGRGLHSIIRIEPAVEFESEAERDRWAATVTIIQHLLPTDPNCLGITALTRPIGSINGKNGKPVTRLKEGKPVSPESVLALCDQAAKQPFRTIAGLLFGMESVTPCPICNRDDSRLNALDQIGMCYAECGKVRLGQILDVFLKPRPSKREK